MANFPGSLPNIPTATSNDHLNDMATIGHVALSNLVAGEVTAVATKVGTGASTPASNQVLRGTGSGTSAWGQVNLGTDVSSVLPVASGGTGATQSTGSGKTVLDTAPTISGASLTGSPTLTTPTIADYSNATHTHGSNSQGGKLTGSTALTAGTVTRTELATITRKVLLDTQRHTQSGIVALWPNTTDNIVIAMFIVPDDYVSGDLTINVFVRGDTTGNCSMYRNAYRFRQNTAFVQVDSTIFTTLAMGTGSILWQFTMSSTNFQAGDIIRWDLHRDGGNVADTAPSDEDCDGVWVEYTGRA